MSNKNNLTASSVTDYQSLHAQIRQLIIEARSSVVKQVNQTLTLTYWQIGRRISIEILDSNRAEYGKQVLRQLSQQLSNEFGEGVGYRNLLRKKLFYDYFSRTRESDDTVVTIKLVAFCRTTQAGG